MNIYDRPDWYKPESEQIALPEEYINSNRRAYGPGINFPSELRPILLDEYDPDIFWNTISRCNCIESSGLDNEVMDIIRKEKNKMTNNKNYTRCSICKRLICYDDSHKLTIGCEDYRICPTCKDRLLQAINAKPSELDEKIGHETVEIRF